jgi:hypothetical protein
MKSGESFSTPRAARNRLATADLKRVTSARSPLGNAAGSPLGNAFSADRCGARFFEVIGRPGPSAKTVGQLARPQAPRGRRELPRSQPFVFNGILPSGRASIAVTT